MCAKKLSMFFKTNNVKSALIDNPASLVCAVYFHTVCTMLKIMHQKVLSEGVQIFFFLVDEGIEDPNTTVNGPSSARQRNVI